MNLLNKESYIIKLIQFGAIVSIIIISIFITQIFIQEKQNTLDSDIKKMEENFLSLNKRIVENLVNKIYNLIELEKDFEKYFHLILSGKNIINSFFDSVMVMDKDEMIKNNRIAILKSLDNAFKQVADIKVID